MEAVEEPPLHNPPVDGMKISVNCDESNENAVASVETDVCHKSNGVAEASESGVAASIDINTATKEDNKVECKAMAKDSEVAANETLGEAEEPTAPSTSEPDTTAAQTIVSSSVVENAPNPEETIVVIEEASNDDKVEIDKGDGANDIKIDENVIEVESVVESIVDRVTFQTEILVESNDNDIIETVCDDTKIEEQDTNNILSELGESIELSEALRSSDVVDNVENNNCAARQAVFNKEELLDILEGNDDAQNLITTSYQMRGDKILEAQLALQQLSRLKKKPKKSRSIERLPRRKSEKRILKKEMTPVTPEVKYEESIVNDLVKEWDDEESTEVEKSSKILNESDSLLKTAGEVVDLQDSVIKDESSVRTSIDSQTGDGRTPTLNKGEEGQPQRRLGRVIKKKVIFDPDNPDTFTKSKIIVKNKEQTQDKDQMPLKKIKSDPTLQSSSSKSATVTKMQWKKPSPKIIKPNKRLTEVDKLLMDEGAVNMIYQLTPEAPKGKKNMKTKAEFIKKIQSSSTPDTKEMKFRERKKESKYEEAEAKRILGGKQRSSLNSSVKSPSVSEDFEAHSADDSIIYRRHSSSSYSSSCMSPRRLSDVENTSQTSRTLQQVADNQNRSNNELSNDRPSVDMFMSDSGEIIRTETINKDDCLSIKEKLNSKLNLALNKRKRENSKADKPMKQKKLMKVDKSVANSEDLKYLSIRFDAKLAVICVQKAGSISNVEIIRELEIALKLIESKKDISVTLIMPECGLTYSDLDLRSLLDDNLENRTNYAYAMADAIRSLLRAVEQHSKLLCAAASDRCSGVGLALIGLSDVAFASERASFALAKSNTMGPVEPGVSVLTTYLHLPQAMLTDLVVFGRRLSASEALQSGLVSRTLWPEKFNEQVLTIAKDIAVQPAQNIWLKKQMLSLKKSGSESTFLKSLEKERDLFVEYWTSIEGQELLRATYNTA